MIIAVLGGKGGVGTSTVAFELAATLDAVVVDADLAMADLPGGRGPDVHDVLGGRASPIEAVREHSGVRVLPCGRSLAGARASDPTKVGSVLEEVAGEYGTTIVDCPSGLRADTAIPLLAADACVLVTTPSDGALAAARRVRRFVRSRAVGIARIALNRTSEVPPAETVRELLGAPVVSIPESTTVARAWELGVPVGTFAPETEPAIRFQQLSEEVAESLPAADSSRRS